MTIHVKGGETNKRLQSLALWCRIYTSVFLR